MPGASSRAGAGAGTATRNAGRRDRAFVSGIILAAGRSSRMARPKQLLPVHGRPLLQHVIDHALAARLDELVLVLGSQAEKVRGALDAASLERLRVVVNPRYADGQSSSLKAGLRAADERSAAAAILLGDQPGVGRELIDLVVAGFIEGDARIVRPEYRSAGEPVPGHPVVLAREVWRTVEALEGDEGARALLREHPDWLRALPIDGPPPPDIDTRDDYERLLGTAGVHDC